MRYDYRYEMAGDIRDYIDNEFGVAILCEMTREDAYNKLYDELWESDSVTGNASGSYTFSSYTAGEYLVGNWDLLLEAMEEFAIFDMNPIEKGEEWCDVTIRCYLLGEVLAEVLDEYFEDELLDRLKDFMYTFYGIKGYDEIKELFESEMEVEDDE